MVVEIIKRISNHQAEGKVLRIIGHKNDPGVDILSIVEKYHINSSFPEDVVEEVKTLPMEVREEDLKGRRDLRDKVIFTIDGDDTRDIDDAISIDKKENGNCLLNEGVIEILEYFKKLNKNLVIVSASEINLLKEQLKKYKIEQYFNDISGLDNINASSKIESARSFLKTKNYDLTKTVFIGDTVECILVCKGHQSKERLQTSHCLVIDNILELKNLLE